MLLSLLAAVALQVTPVPQFDVKRDAITVCQMHFYDNVKRIQAGGNPDSPLIDLYAEKAKLDVETKNALETTCVVFDKGALFAIKLLAPVEDEDEDRGKAPGRSPVAD